MRKIDWIVQFFVKISIKVQFSSIKIKILQNGKWIYNIVKLFNQILKDFYRAYCSALTLHVVVK